MKNIGIDARLYFQTGVGVYLRNLLYYLQKIDKKNNYHVYVLKKDSPKIKFTNKNFLKVEVSALWHSLDEQMEFLNIINGDNLDLMHFTYFGHPIFYKRKFIVTIHDLTPLFFKTGASTKNDYIYGAKFFVFKNLILPNQVKKSEGIIVPTETIKKQIVEYYGPSFSNKIKVIYEGVNHEYFNTKPNRKLNYKNFLLRVGNFYPHKNTENLIRAFAKIKHDINLLLVGPDDYFAAEMKNLVKELKQEKRIIFFHNPTNEDFVYFYQNARALVYPSLAEGFGLPIAEAIYFNLSIIASDIPVFKELLGDKYLSFDPKNIDNIKSKIEEFLKKELKFNYGDLLNKYSFEKMTKETLEIYKKSI